MLIIDDQLLELDDTIEELVIAITQTEQAKSYQAAKIAFDRDESLQDMIADFALKKTAYEQVADYAAYLPEVKDKKKRSTSSNGSLIYIQRS